MSEGFRQRPGDQPLPTESSGPIMHELVAQDLRARLELGVSRYGQPLRAFNGRNAAKDAYEEMFDLALGRQWQIEREVMIGVLRDVAAAETEAERIHVAATAQALLESMGASSG